MAALAAHRGLAGLVRIDAIPWPFALALFS
jgi:hypothetical protein